ncbi:hypothetical protein [Chryseobacterium chendengshani]|uniref:hypothetical protein n=1 Tax=unclassified Chryseobacterium TaxID=2593645 RepID=UPI001C63FC4C|nr:MULTISPECIES: hypothetical protein [unclassified Chryseobacterium]MBW7675103.1 hypothetical protein [Chryseobacterium sp. LJ756]MBW8522344.1 hypothetical protein [Chryseobacterium sp. LJ668]QYK17983.1 hypothetical protein K0U91_07650 [Chryseobacterium sp. LJ668]
MRNNLQMAQGIISVLAILCLVAGWFQLFSPEVNDIVSRKLFYLLIGLSFILQAPLLSNTKFIYPMYGAAALCIIGAFLPIDSNFSFIKTIGLLGGVIISFTNRSATRQ